jgi:uncharacterized glyoxalase superfamily protein PhnB
MTTTPTPRPTLDAFGLVVASMPATLAFYRRLGLVFPDGADELGHVEAQLAGGVRLMIDTVETIHSFDPAWTAPTGGHRVALAFACASPSEVDSVYAELAAAGYTSHLDPFDAPWGMRYAAMLDPDGNPAELYANLA